MIFSWCLSLCVGCTYSVLFSRKLQYTTHYTTLSAAVRISTGVYVYCVLLLYYLYIYICVHLIQIISSRYAQICTIYDRSLQYTVYIKDIYCILPLLFNLKKIKILFFHFSRPFEMIWMRVIFCRFFLQITKKNWAKKFDPPLSMGNNSCGSKTLNRPTQSCTLYAYCTLYTYLQEYNEHAYYRVWYDIIIQK